ncbi:MAG: acyltransferase [Lacunisphaera sp.]|nr:acyltransferase [Lacunisphaera sp.]
MNTIPPPPAPDRNAYIDTLRGWSIVGVVCVHFAGSFVTTDIHAWSPSFWLGLTLNQVFGFAVPLFLFLSGLLAGASSKVVPLGDYYRARLWRIGFPYALASLASFFLLNHYATWQALPDIGAKFTWLWQHVFFYGVEPTLYFIPLILQLYFLQPALKALPRWLNRLVPALSPAHGVLLLTGLLLALHVTLGLLCYHGTLNYYVWGRPNALFWVFYFFAGLHFRTLAGLLSRRTLAISAGLTLLVAAVTMAWNGLQLADPTLVGLNFERNRLDFAYVRPEMLIYDLAMVAGLATGIALGWAPRAGLVAYLGRYTLEIYLWHILVLYFGVWRYAGALDSCRQLPEMIVLICLGTAVLIALVTDGFHRLRAFIRDHRLVLVKSS